MAKGAVVDFIIIGVILLVFAVLSLILFTIMGAFSDEMGENTRLNQTTGHNITIQAEADVTTSFDYGFALIFFGMNIGILFFSFLVRSHPIFFILAILGIAIIAVMSLIMSDIYSQAVLSNADVALKASQMPIMDWIMTNLVPLQILFGFIDAIVLYGVASWGGGQEGA